MNPANPDIVNAKRKIAGGIIAVVTGTDTVEQAHEVSSF
jgi:hypothetical protein